MAAPAPYPVNEIWTTKTSPGTANPAARLVEAVQREDITRADIARTVAQLNPQLHALVAAFVDETTGRMSVHKFCAQIRAYDPGTLDRAMDVLCNQQVSSTLVSQAHVAMQEQRERQRQWRQRADLDGHD